MKKSWLAFVIFFVITAAAQTHPVTPERTLAVNALRALNTAEVDYAHNAGHFGTWNDLRPIIAKWKAGHVKGKWNDALRAFNIDSNSDPLPGWKLRVTVGTDGQHYSLILNNDRKCDVNGFSDDRGVIYLGTTLGCGETASTP